MSGTEDEEHSSAIKTPKQLITVIVAAFVFPVLIIMLIGHLVTGNPPVDSDSPAFSNQAVAKRLKPVGTLALASDSLQPEVSSVADPGVAAGAPKLGDKAAWAARIKAGNESLYSSALKGKNAMPAKGGNASLSDSDVKSVVDYMISESK